MQKTHKLRGLSAHMLIIPATAIIVFLYAMLVFRSTRIDNVKEQLFANSDAYIGATQTYDSFRRNVTKMTDQAGFYFATGDARYAESFCDLANRYSESDPASDVLFADTSDGGSVSALWEELTELEARAVKLFVRGSGADLTGPEYQRIMAATLTDDEENNMTGEQQREAAEKLLYGEECYVLRGRIMEKMDERCDEMLAETNARFLELSQLLNRYTSVQAVFTTVLCVFLIFVLGFLYIMLLLPLNRATRRVRNGEEIGIRHGVLELKSLSEHYDQLIERKTILEDDLRQSAHLDALTGLPNRLAEKQYISSIRRSQTNLPTAVLSMDVNNLKPTNDTQGHVAGDMLLQRTAKCILKYFGDQGGQNCFRIGGDEFVAILQDVTEAEVRDKIRRFEQCQSEADISVAIGYAYSEDARHLDFSELFSQADRNMYKVKSEMKQRLAENAIAMAVDSWGNNSTDKRKSPTKK